MLRVAFIFAHQDQQWLGGIHYLKNLLTALKDCPQAGVEPVILCGRKAKKSLMEGFPPLETIETSLLDRRHPAWIARKILAKILGRDWLLERLLRANGIRLLSHSDDLGPRAAIPTIGWIPDFQHNKLDGFFSDEVRAFRDRYFHRLGANCRRVVLSSENARGDMALYLPAFVGKAGVLRFVDVSTPAFPEILPLAELEKKYSFQGPFVHLPNQFWKHKNHGVVIEALAELKKRGFPALVVATGNTSDNRHPNYFPSLERRIAELGVADSFRILGLVPYRDLVSLMRHSRALLNPSFFEGWSTSVEEGKSLGKIVILSDIPVHREQAPPGGLYFRPDDPAELAAHLAKALNPLGLPEAGAVKERAEREFAARKQGFALAFGEIANGAV